jgi:hypothetical protein
MKNNLISDCDVIDLIKLDDLWIIDKFILSKKLGYHCGPAGVIPPKPDNYIVRPCVNIRMMAAGAKFTYIDNQDIIPDGYFWCEIFQGRHLSFDYNYGKQVLAVEGFRDDPNRLDRFSHWNKITDVFILPDLIQRIANNYEWLNVETIGDKIIEVHFRYNDDFSNHDADTIIPIWKEEFYHSSSGDRLGFLLKKNEKNINNNGQLTGSN